MTSPHPPEQQHVVPQQPYAGQLAPPAIVPARRRRWPWIVLAAVVLALAGVGTWLALPTDDDRAVDACKTEIGGKLKSPAGAKYSGETIDHEAGSIVWRIAGTVDAQNGFGATVRGSYRCTLAHEKDGTWSAVEATVDQR